jgi:hypothetical protein
MCQLIQSRIVQAINSYNNIHQIPSLWDIMASWLKAVSDNSERPTIDWFKPCKVDLNTRKNAYPKKVQQTWNGVYTDQAVPVDLQLRSGTYIPWYKAYWLAHTRTSRLTQVQHCCKRGDTSLCPRCSRERFPCRVNRVLGLPVPFPASV